MYYRTHRTLILKGLRWNSGSAYTQRPETGLIELVAGDDLGVPLAGRPPSRALAAGGRLPSLSQLVPPAPGSSRATFFLRDRDPPLALGIRRPRIQK